MGQEAYSALCRREVPMLLVLQLSKQQPNAAVKDLLEGG